ncbi:protein of unknown function [Taphrina deformans PYCC 5710]|uniref:Uncharacterized protein n=1 Tax=Taphrina deformans (strain PYCC 5710 / ATCC 11124 / CBS 356.35 / IMI 108563 / JCM 9778 / NBRC 8474) TaxID=1097556 RepID=R4XLD1_TAPDE|nr:protein of unknown function [Taphrina deformans PYCC 5710]|eukprot:CCG85165.1 protein of unknown function [Taphrina deformans PYCC 5710]
MQYSSLLLLLLGAAAAQKAAPPATTAPAGAAQVVPPAAPAPAPAGAGAGAGAVAAAGIPAGISASKTDVGSILKSMDQTKLATIPANARAVMKKMPETPTDVTMEDRSAIKACLASDAVDALGKAACAAQDDQLTVVLDKKRVSNANMMTFVKSAMAAGGKVAADA